MKIKILYEDNHLIAVFKPAGILVQPDISKKVCLMDEVKKYLKEKYNKKGKVFLGLCTELTGRFPELFFLPKPAKALQVFPSSYAIMK